MNDKIEVKHEEWLSGTGDKQECWVVLRNSWELGRIQQFGSKYMAMQNTDNGHYKHKYFVRFNKATEWLIREMANIRPISELNAFLV